MCILLIVKNIMLIAIISYQICQCLEYISVRNDHCFISVTVFSSIGRALNHSLGGPVSNPWSEHTFSPFRVNIHVHVCMIQARHRSLILYLICMLYILVYIVVNYCGSILEFNPLVAKWTYPVCGHYRQPAIGTCVVYSQSTTQTCVVY